MPEILLVRHAQSEANQAGVWSGRSDGPLSDAGLASLDLLARRFGSRRPDLVVSSPLLRARQTAEAIAGEFEVDDDLIEMDLGRWDGWTRDQVTEDDQELLREATAGRVLRMGRTGESLTEAESRAAAALDRIFERLGERQRAVVVTHAGLLQAYLHRYLAGRGRRVHAPVANTSITRLVESFGHPRLAGFNDQGHLGPRTKAVAEHLEQGRPVLALVRHGQTLANIEGRWQGQGDWDLDSRGIEQAEALGDWYGSHPLVYSSTLSRARSTAGFLAANGVVEIPELRELSMGSWEGLTTPEIEERHPELLETIYRRGVDLRRGGDGESWGELTHRFGNALRALDTAPGEPTVVVAHGGAIRAYVSSLTALHDAHSESLFTPPNTSVTHVAFTPEGPLLLDYGVAPHLESLS